MRITTAIKPGKQTFRSKEAAEYLGISSIKLYEMRRDDRKAMRERKPTAGPKFIDLSTSMVVYRREDLDRWLLDCMEATQRAMVAAGRQQAAKRK